MRVKWERSKKRGPQELFFSPSKRGLKAIDIKVALWNPNDKKYKK